MYHFSMKCLTLGRQKVYGISLRHNQFCCEPKAALTKSIKKKKKDQQDLS